jgi:predicted HicB family RNase H-like nuclease
MLTRGDDGVFTVQVRELPGAISEGDTADEALVAGRKALAGVIGVMLDRGQTIPEPDETREYSGTLQLRIPPSLHARATFLARDDGVSLNRFLSAAVATYVGHKEEEQSMIVTIEEDGTVIVHRSRLGGDPMDLRWRGTLELLTKSGVPVVYKD